jgi:hypothetical protein
MRLIMQTIKYFYWKGDGARLGYIEEYPDYWTQGNSLEDLIEHLKDLFVDLNGGHIPGARKVGELQIS